ncbi:type 3 dihydrofolate reductase [Frischella sp. Ac48]|uniref:Dihydrofolate reductase n=1 Tax=Frischella japonica TaxID=2741544 RepID=A0ABR7QZI2_9GAMM|nr:MULTISPECIES: type 3 dihydrofolate reductase [Frischella]MBC9131631.1 type 3 dihydrofolate reductase [Frischella japonica]MBX4134077.1 type 3 dihydrofolate reductase [Frischella sp. Ac48]
MILSIIVAMANNQVIGLNNQMPWHLPADLAWFKKNTLHKPVIMGRKTFESIGRPLPNRHNIIISRTPQTSNNPNITWTTSLPAALAIVKTSPEVFIIGGGNIYQQVLPQVNRLYLTHINTDVAGDTHFPNYHCEQWQSIFKEYHLADEKNPYDYWFEILEKK